MKDRIYAQRLNSCKLFLKNNKNLFFTIADKGNKTVCLNVNDYNEKMKNLLSDKSTYHIKNRSKTLLDSLQKSSSNFLKQWNDKGWLEKVYNDYEISQTHTILPRIYGLPKLHKLGIPLRPVFSNVNSPTSLLAKNVSDLLYNCLNPPDSYIKNSFDLCEKLTKLKIPEDHSLISLDVSSLFTNIPLELVLKSLKNKKRNISRNIRNIPYDDIKKAVEFLYHNTYFTFNDTVYRQRTGTPMGSSVSSLFADIVMQDLENSCLKKLKFKTAFFYRYVDDILTTVPNDKIDFLLKTFNSYHPKLKFTSELEKNSKINFLEISINRNNDKLINNWQRKEICSDRTFHFHSNHPIHQKISIIYSLVDKAILLSNHKLHNDNIKKVREILINNEYPEYFIQKYINKRMFKINADKNNVVNNTNSDNNFNSDNNNNNIIANRNRLYSRMSKIRIPYKSNIFHNLKSILRKYNILAIPQNVNNLTNVIKKGKDRINTLDCPSVVYKIDCKNCDRVYIGHTKRALKKRVYDHNLDVKNLNHEKSVIAEHCVNKKHDMKWDNVKILDKELNYRHRLISESLNIYLHKNNINKQTDTKFLHNSYKSLLDNFT